MLRCVHRCQRGEYVFAPQRRDRPHLWHAREPFDDAQLTALSNPLRAEQLGGRQRRRQRRRARSAQCRRRPADAGTRARRLRFVAPQHRLSPQRVQAGHTDAVVARCLFRVTPPLSTTSRARAASVSPRCPCVRSSTSPSSPLPASRPTSRPAQGARSQERCRVGAREDTAAATAATQAVSSEQLNSQAVRVAVGNVLERFSELEV